MFLCWITDYIQLFTVYDYLYNSVKALLKNAVCLFDLRKGEAVGNEWGSIDFTFTYKLQHFFAVTAVHTTGLECEIFAIHLWKR